MSLCLISSASAQEKLTQEQSRFFEAKIRPVLAANCYQCHSVEQGKAKGGLVLDSRDGLLKGGEHGKVITPGDAENSKLIKAINHVDPDLSMPPKEKLSEREIADLTAWVKMGAPDPRTAAAGVKLTGLTDKAKAHWAYQPVKTPQVPEAGNKAWVKTPVDAFVLAKLEASGMKPSPPASKETLLRRATYDLIGLPPTPEELKAFVADLSPNAFEKVIDRLMASPHYGERWGRFWLDSARYSDTTGAENNNRREDYRYAHAWTYRDYVINSFNADKPYDQFLKEQIAADLLPSAKTDPDSLAALGFITVGKRFQNPNDTIDERIDSLTKATMGITVACARCHDHKFDPIPTADYYSLHGIFNSVYEPVEKPLIGKAPAATEYQEYLKKKAAIEARNRDLYYKIVAEQGEEFREKAAAYLAVATLYRSNDAAATKYRNELIQKQRLDRNLYQGLRARPDHPVLGLLFRFAQLPEKDFASGADELIARMDRARGPRMRMNPLVAEAFKKVKPGALKNLSDVAEVYAGLFKSVEPQAKKWLEANRNAKDAVSGFDEDLVEVLNIPARIEPAGKLDNEGLKEVARTLPQQNDNVYRRFAFAEINELELTHDGSPARAMIVSDMERPRNSPILIRGEQQNRGAIVPRQFLEIVAGKDRKPFREGSGRLELANAIATKDNPLTVRVAINRVWLRHFGEGIVRTPDDLGVQSEPPSHPDLLDYLSARFVEDGWSFKKMHKLIMLSNAYQQSSDTNKEYATKDPDNRLLWRANLRRLDFEAVRDTLLQFTGKLDRTIGGKPVNLTDEPYSNRRSVYGYIDRGNVPELMEQFDFADPDMANSKRTATIVPQQALFFMNSPMAADVARKVVSRPEFVNAKDDYAKVRAIYQVIFQRAPRPEEMKLGAEFYNAKTIADRRNGGPAEVRRPEMSRRDQMRDMRRPGGGMQGMRPGDGKRAIQNEGERVDRRPLTVWEEYVQALLFTNEIAYVN